MRACVFGVRWLSIGSAVLLLAMAAPDAKATLTFDLRVVGGGKTVNTVTVSQVVNLELFAVVTGAAGNAGLEGFQDGWMTIASDNGGNVRGNLSGTLTTTFAATSSQNGTAQDLDGDGDADLGSMQTFAAQPDPDGGYLFARALSMQTTSGVAITNGREFKLANLTFTVTAIGNPVSPTPIALNVFIPNFSSTIDIEAVWLEDGVGSSMEPTPGGTFPNSFPLAGSAVLIRAIPEPGTALLLVAGALAFTRRRPRSRGRDA